MEIWKPISDYPGYEASNKGQIRSIDRIVMCKDGRKAKYKGRIIRQVLNKKTGYLTIHLGSWSPTEYVHILILETFVGKRPYNFDADHKDKDRTNNCLSNLRWLDTKSNRGKSGEQNNQAKLSEKDVLFIRKNYKPRCSKYGQNALARKFNVRQSLIYGIIHGLWWKDIK